MFYQGGRNGFSPGDPLYSNVQRFHFRNGFGEERLRDLRVVVDLSSAFGKSTKQVLQVQLMDDDDPFFYYSLLVTEEDYLRLKSSQGLLVDFDSFPAQVVRLLEQCKDHEAHSSKFLLLLLEEEGRGDTARTTLKIVEANNFRHLCHLALHIERGGDEDIKKLMIKKIQSLKEQNSKAENIILSLESQLSSKNSLLDAAELRASDIEHRWKEERKSFQAESAKGLTEESDKLRRAQLDWQLKSQREKTEIEEKYRNILRDKESEVSKLRIENQIFLDKKGHAEGTLSEMGKRVESIERELAAVRSDLASSRKYVHAKDNEIADKDRILNNARSKLTSLEAELREKTAAVSHLEEAIQSSQEAKSRLEAALREKEAYATKKQKTIHNVSEELIKANDIIGKLQKELAASALKLKTRTEIALEQEKVIEKHEKLIERLDRELGLKTKRLESFEGSEETLRGTVAELKESLDAKDRKLAENEKIIDWLNKRCTEQAVLSYNPSLPFTTDSPKTTSTPFERLKEARAPLTAVKTPLSRFNVLALDKMDPPPEAQPTTGLDQSPENEVPTASSDRKTASTVDPPKILTKKSAPIKKLPTVPSSYFMN